MKMKNIKILLSLGITAVVLLSSQPAEARRARDVNNVSISLRQTLISIGYEQEAEEVISLIGEIFPDLGELRGLPAEERISVLAGMIKQRIELYNWQEGKEVLYFDLPEVLRDKKALCLGYAQIVFVLGKTLRLEVEVMRVWLDRYRTHTANLIKLDSGYVVLDLSVADADYYKSKIFVWEEDFEEEGVIWRLKAGSSIARAFEIVQRINEQGIIASRYINSGIIKGKLGLYEKARQDFDRAIDLEPDNPDGFYNRGIAKVVLGLYGEAISDFDKAIVLNPYNANVFYQCGLAKTELNLYDEALYYFDRAIDLNPDDAGFWFNRGWVYFVLDKTGKARADFKEAIRINPELYSQLPSEIQGLLK